MKMKSESKIEECHSVSKIRCF